MRTALKVGGGLLMVVYPLLVYFGMDHYGPRGLALLLIVVVLVRFFSQRPQEVSQWLWTAILLGLCLLVLLLDSPDLLKLYPVVFSLGLSTLFLVSLSGEMTLIERMARLAGDNPTMPAAKRYMRNLTWIWAILLILNAAVAAWTALFASLYWWTLYNGLISYLILGGFMLMEMLYRRRYKRLHGVVSGG